MDSQDGNIEIAASSADLSEICIQSKRKKRKSCIKAYSRHYTHLPLITELRENFPEDFKNFLRMDSSCFDSLLSKLRHRISKKDTVLRKSISAEERLAVTLRFLSSGRSFEDLKNSSGISTASLSILVPETCKAIYDVLRTQYMRFPRFKEEWIQIAHDFQEKWQFINCGGSMDGKHIRIVPPSNSGANYYNYKNYHSIVLMALVGPNYEFLFVDVGKSERISGGGVLEYTEFYQKLLTKQLNLPENEETVSNLNFVYLGDKSFELDENILKPYTNKHRELDHAKQVFNYRLSRARSVVENTFGIIASRFKILRTAIKIKNPKSICHMVMAICTLHNYLLVSSDSYITDSDIDIEDTDSGTVKNGDWRASPNELLNLQESNDAFATHEAKQNRENYKKYFMSEGKVEWQDLMIANKIA